MTKYRWNDNIFIPVLVYNIPWLNVKIESRYGAGTPWWLYFVGHEAFTLFIMMTSSNGNIFRVTDHLCGEFTCHRVNSPHKGRWREALMFSLICAWLNGWINNREAGDLRRHHTYHEVTVMENPETAYKKIVCVVKSGLVAVTWHYVHAKPYWKPNAATMPALSPSAALEFQDNHQYHQWRQIWLHKNICCSVNLKHQPQKSMK